jgi:hypothetical protein
MAYPTIGTTGAVTSWGSANFYSQLLANMKTMNATITDAADALDSTGLGDVAMANRVGLTTIDIALSGFAFATPRVGNTGIVAFNSGGYVLYVNEFDLDLSAPALDYTAFASGSPPTFRNFRPGLFSWRGSYRGIIDSATAIIPANRIGDTLKTLTFTYGTDSANDTLAGSVVITPMEAAIQAGNLNTVGYSFVGTGALTSNGTNALFGTGSNPTSGYSVVPTWSAGGSVAGAMVITADTGRTYTITDSFWTSLRLRCQVGGLVSVEATVKGLTANAIG